MITIVKLWQHQLKLLKQLLIFLINFSENVLWTDQLQIIRPAWSWLQWLHKTPTKHSHPRGQSEGGAAEEHTEEAVDGEEGEAGVAGGGGAGEDDQTGEQGGEARVQVSADKSSRSPRWSPAHAAQVQHINIETRPLGLDTVKQLQHPKRYSLLK